MASKKTDSTSEGRPPMPIRDGAGGFNLDNPDDGTPIREMFSLKDRMLLITDKCTYEVRLADQIDPKRTNPALPHNVRRKLFDHGVNSDVLCKTLLQAKALFKEGFVSVDINAATTLTLNALQEFVAMDGLLKEFADSENIAIQNYSQTKQQARSIGLPSVGNIEGCCKTFAQKAHHFGRALLSTARLFYPAASNWDKLQEIAEAKYGSDDEFTKFIASIKPTLSLVLDMRDGLEHQLAGVTVRDFTLEPDGTIAPPTIELKLRKSKLPRCSVSHIMREIAAALQICFEMTIVHMCSKRAEIVAGLQVHVVEMSEDDQKARHVKFGYGAYTPDGRFLTFL